MASYTLDIEAVSCDELYADVTSILQRTSIKPDQFAAHLRQLIAEKTQCTASVGMSANLLLARLATKKAKPNGFFYLSKDQSNQFVKELLVRDLPGVGRSISHRLSILNVETCSQLQQLPLSKLQ